jgi:hypothetical protein
MASSQHALEDAFEIQEEVNTQETCTQPLDESGSSIFDAAVEQRPRPCSYVEDFNFNLSIPACMYIFHTIFVTRLDIVYSNPPSDIFF